MKLRNKKTGKVIEWFNNTDGVFPNTLAELNAEWEDYDDESDFWFIDEILNVSHCQRKIPHHIIERFKKVKNYYKTEKQAIKTVEKIRAWLRLRDNCNIHFSGLNRDRKGRPVSVNLEFDKEGRTTFDEAVQNVKDLTLLFGGENETTK